MKILVAVDGSEHSLKSVAKLVETLAWYKDPPQIELVTVHLPVPHLPGMGAVVSQETIDKHYREEGEKQLAPSKALLDKVGARYRTHIVVGPVAESIVAEGEKLGVDAIWMGTRGMSGLSNVLMGSTATKLLHIASVPVTLVR